MLFEFVLKSLLIKNLVMIKLVMMGDHNAGRTTIAKILFQKFVTSETMSLASTASQEYDFKIHEINFRLYDMPAEYCQESYLQTQISNIANSYALIYVINPQLGINDSLQKFTAIYNFMNRHNQQQLNYFIFIHKYDIQLQHPEARQQFIRKVKISLNDKKVAVNKIDYQFTSILNYSIHLAFSKVIQTVLPCTNILNRVLDKLVDITKIQKVFIFDIVTKLVIAQNDSFKMLEENSYHIFSEMADLYVGLSMYLENSEEEEDPQKRDKMVVKMKESNQVEKTYRFDQIQHSLTICLIIESFNYELEDIFDMNMSILAKGVIRMMNALNQFI